MCCRCGENKQEYKQLFTELHFVLKDAIKLRTKHPKDIPESDIRRLQDRIDRLASASCIDLDCKRYVKRLRREGHQLLTFLKHSDVPYHNNTSGRAVRTFALMRNVCHGNRSKRGIKTSEIMATIYATCGIRGVNPYTFMRDYLDGKTDTIPLPQNSMTAVSACA